MLCCPATQDMTSIMFSSQAASDDLRKLPGSWPFPLLRKNSGLQKVREKVTSRDKISLASAWITYGGD